MSSAHHSQHTHTTDRAGTVCVCVCVCVCLWSLFDLSLRRNSAAASSSTSRRSIRLFISRCPTLLPLNWCRANEPVSEICSSPLRSSLPELLLSLVARPQLPKHREPAPSPRPVPCLTPTGRVNPGPVAQACPARAHLYSPSLPFLFVRRHSFLAVRLIRAAVPHPNSPIFFHRRCLSSDSQYPTP